MLRPHTTHVRCALASADQFGDLTKKAVSNFTGKEEYQFGDITKTIGQALFGNKPKKPKK